jgi:hypothetical protein
VLGEVEIVARRRGHQVHRNNVTGRHIDGLGVRAAGGCRGCRPEAFA